MRRYLLGVLIGTVFAGSAVASTYTEFNTGLNDIKREDWDGAIQHLSAALAASDLNPAFRAPAYADRATAYSVKKQPDKALADLAAALQADPQYLTAYMMRFRIHLSLKQYDAAVQDLTYPIAIDPKLTVNYGRRGYIYLLQKNYDAALADATTIETLNQDGSQGYAMHAEVLQEKGDYPGATKDLGTAIRNAPKDAYLYEARAHLYLLQGNYRDERDDLKSAQDISATPETAMQIGIADWKLGDYRKAASELADVKEPNHEKAKYVALWSYIASARNGAKPAAFDGSPSSPPQWPDPLMAYFAGQSTPEAVLKAAESTDKDTEKNQICETNFYIGEMRILNKDMDGGEAMLAKAASDCPEDFIERDAASVDLKRLKEGRT